MVEGAIRGEVIFEFRRIGNSVKVSAIHVPSNTEVSLVGAAGAGEQTLKAAALQKLRYVIAKNSSA